MLHCSPADFEKSIGELYIKVYGSLITSTDHFEANSASATPPKAWAPGIQIGPRAVFSVHPLPGQVCYLHLRLPLECFLLACTTAENQPVSVTRLDSMYVVKVPALVLADLLQREKLCPYIALPPIAQNYPSVLESEWTKKVNPRISFS